MLHIEDSENGYCAGDGDDDGSYGSEEQRGGARVRFENEAVGSVVRRTYIDEHSMAGLNRTEVLQVKSSRSTALKHCFSPLVTMQNLWGEDAPVLGQGAGSVRGERLRGMAQSSGMEFASNPGEFDARVHNLLCSLPRPSILFVVTISFLSIGSC